MSTAQQSDTVHAPAAGSGVELPDYAASQRAALKAEREAMYREYEAATLAAETGYVGSNGTFRIPPNNMVSGVLKMGFYVKHKVVTKAKRKKSMVSTDVTTEESTLVPGYEHVGEENGSPVSNDTTGAGQASNGPGDLPHQHVVPARTCDAS